jgi:hypothetical protein
VIGLVIGIVVLIRLAHAASAVTALWWMLS